MLIPICLATVSPPELEFLRIWSKEVKLIWKEDTNTTVMLLQINSFFYSQVKEIVEEHQTSRYRWKHRFDVFIFFQYVLRLSCVVYMHVEPDFAYWRFDHLGSFSRRYSDLYNYQFVILLILFLCLAMVGKKVSSSLCS